MKYERFRNSLPSRAIAIPNLNTTGSVVMEYSITKTAQITSLSRFTLAVEQGLTANIQLQVQSLTPPI